MSDLTLDDLPTGWMHPADPRHLVRERLRNPVPAPEGYDADECFVCGTPVEGNPLCEAGHYRGRDQ